MLQQAQIPVGADGEDRDAVVPTIGDVKTRPGRVYRDMGRVGRAAEASWQGRYLRAPGKGAVRSAAQDGDRVGQLGNEIGDRQARVTHQMPRPRSCDGTIGDAGLRDPARRAIDMMRENGVGTEVDRMEDVAAAIEAHPMRMRAGLSLGFWPAALVLGDRGAARRKPRRRVQRP